MTVKWRLRDGRKSALKFGGASTDEHVEADTYVGVGGTTNRAVSAWIQTDTDADQIITMWGDGTTGGKWTFRLDDAANGDRVIRVEVSGGYIRGTTPVDDGQIHHVTCSLDGSDVANCDLYVDGDAETIDSSASQTIGTDDTSAFRVGMRNTVVSGTGGRVFDGTIDDVRVFRRALTASEVSALSLGDDVTDGLDLHYELDEGEGSTAADSSGNGNDGTLYNSPEWVEGIAPDAFDERLLDVPECTLAYNRFARSAEAEIDNPDGDAQAEYPRGTPVELEVKRDIDPSWRTRLGGYVNGYETTQHTATLKILSHDNWIRAREVYRSYSATAKSTILKELITDLTPLRWDASRVNVYNDDAIDASWSGVALDKVLTELSKASNEELFGATDDMVFFFEQRDTQRAPRDFTQGEYFADSVEFEEDGSVELNEVVVYYGGEPASDAVLINDPAAQAQLKEELGADSPVVISDSKTFTDITTEATARRKGNEILSGATAIQTGELTTWEGFGVDPGDLTSVAVPEQDIDAEFRVAEISHSWKDDETKVKLAENNDGVVDTLVELSDEISRVEARAAANNPTIARFPGLGLPIAVDFEIEAYKRTHRDDEFRFGQGIGGSFGYNEGKLGDRRSVPEKIL